MPLNHNRRSSDAGDGDGTSSYHRRPWVFERRISLDTIVGVFGIAIAVGVPLLLAWQAVNSRILTIEVKDEIRTKADEKRDQEMREFRAQITGQLSRVSDQITQTQITLGVMGARLPAAAETHK